MSTENPEQPADQSTPEPAPDEPETESAGSTLEQPPIDSGNSDAGLEAGDAAQADVIATEVVDPAQVRKAPRFRSFILVGVFSGLFIGLIVGVIAFHGADNLLFMTLVLMVDLTIVTTVLALLWAILSDRRSGRRGAAANRN